LTLLLAALVVVFVAGALAIRILDARRIQALVSDRTREKSALFDRLVELQSKPYQVFSYDYSYWDDMVRFVSRPESGWARENIDEGMGTFGADAAWVLTTDHALIYAAAGEGYESLAAPPLPQPACSEVFSRTWFPHFWIETGQGLMEVWGAPIQPSSDNARETPPQGFFIVGKVWSDEVVGELSRLVEGSVQLEGPSSGADREESMSGKRPGLVAFRHALSDRNGETTATVLVQSRSDSIAEMARQSNRLFLLVAVLAALVQLILSLSLMTWVNRPLDLISRTLKQEDPGLVAPLETQRHEFGNLARLIRGFFEQREKLVAEVAERKQAQSELARHQLHLEELVQERTRELQRAQQQLLRNERLAALGQAAGGIAHELRNPLTAIRNSTYYLNTVHGSTLPEKAVRNLATIEEQVERSSRIITNLLDFARGRPAQVEECRVEDILHEAVRQAALPTGVEVAFGVPDGLPQVMVDPGQMVQVFLNLLANAGQAMGGTGRITVEVRSQKSEGRRQNETGTADSGERIEEGARGQGTGGREDPEPRTRNPEPGVMVFVKDAGPGIAPEALPRIFEPLFTTKSRGVGLGLAICKSFVERNGGVISVESEPGKGATFIVTLPVAEPLKPQATSREQPK